MSRAQESTRIALKAARQNTAPPMPMGLSATQRHDIRIRDGIERVFKEQWAPVIDAAAERGDFSVRVYVGGDTPALDPTQRYGKELLKEQGYQVALDSTPADPDAEYPDEAAFTRHYFVVFWPPSE